MKRCALLILVVLAALSACTPKQVAEWISTTEATELPVVVTSPQVPTSLPAPYVDPCDPAILDLPWSEDAPFAGWLPPACDDVERIDGVRTFPVPTITQEDQ